MSLSTNIEDLTIRVATQAKILKTLINGNAADLTGLQTTAKSNLVSAINELNSAIGSAGAKIDDTAASTARVYSSSKTESVIQDRISALVDASPETLDTLKELGDALGGDPNFATTITTLIGTKANDSDVVKLSGAQSIAGAKTFTVAPTVPDNSFTTAKVSGLQTALDGKAPTNHSHVASQLPKASETGEGIVEIATASEVTTGTDASRVITPLTLKNQLAQYATLVNVGNTDQDFVAIFEAGIA